MLAFAPSHPSKKVVFADWDSEEEGQRSARGIEFRQRLKEDRKNKKMAEREARRLRNLEIATRAYAALILPANHNRLEGLDRTSSNFFRLFEPFFRTLADSAELGRHVLEGNDGGTTIQLVYRLSCSGITFEQILEHHPDLEETLFLIGCIPDFKFDCMERRAGHVSSSSDED